jgi:hypothetical protein
LAEASTKYSAFNLFVNAVFRLLSIFWKNKIKEGYKITLLSVCPLSLLGNCMVNTSAQHRRQMHQKKTCWMLCFLCGPCNVRCSIVKGKQAVSSFHIFLLSCCHSQMSEYWHIFN